MNRLVCRFDPTAIDPTQDFAPTPGGDLTIDRRGLFLEASGADIRFAISARQLLVLFGRPHARESGLDAALKREGPGALLAGMGTSPATLANALGGRFALLWIDLDKSCIAGLTDRFGTHPICWSREGGALLLGSRAELVPRAAREVDPQAIFDFLYFHVIPAPRTIFRGTLRLEPGHLLTADRTGQRDVAWWQPRFTQTPVSDLPALEARFRDGIRDAVAREVAGDARTAAFLSGGTDSSTVIGMMKAAKEGAPRGYSIGFDAAGYDEMEYARIAARAYGVDHREYYITAQDLVRNIPAVAAHYDQPFGNSSALPAFCLARLAREDGYDKLLAGDGGDELFGGNSRYAKQKVFEIYRAIPGLLRAGLLDPIARATWSQGVPGLAKVSSYVKQAQMSPLARTEQYNLLQRLGRDSVLHPAFAAHTDADAPLRLRRMVWDGIAADTVLDRELGFDWRFTLADNDLPKVIGTTSLAGLDVGFPLLSEELLDISLALPDHYKLKGFQLRWFFKDALRDFLPAEILSKKKHGFGLPFGHWALTDPALKRLSEESLNGLVERRLLNGHFVGDLFSKLLPAHPGYYGEMVWIGMMLEQWLRANAPQTRF
ncbi:asparagine synthase [Niveibacterium umoris]|nr:asparagine synthetase B family protein [Niveibacterium umoris]